MEALILHKAKELFYSYGLKAISMDDIARSSGVSKKTVYQHFSCKDEILSAVVKNFISCHKQALEKCRKETSNAVEEVISISQLFVHTINHINQNFFYDLEKSFPEAWQLIAEYRKKFVVPAILRNLRDGMDQEIYRDDLDIAFIADVRMQQVVSAFTPRLFAETPVQGNKLMMQLSEFYLHGIASLKGKKMINKYLNVHHENKF